MPTEANAKAAFSAVRKYYESGLKSANKNYDLVHASWWKSISGKAAKRNVKQGKASIALGVQRSSEVYDNADILNKGRLLFEGQLPSANCGELACASCWYLSNYRHVPSNQLAMVSVSGGNLPNSDMGADHAFCVYGDADILNALATTPAFDSIPYINGAKALRGTVYAIDPWANTLCWLDQYPAKIAEKMASWSAYGKRVLWVWDGPPYDGSNVQGAWSDPGGAYATVFARADLTFTIC